MQRRQLQYFIEVVDCGSISAAAQKLFVAQPSLSRTINAMEHEMNGPLLERTGLGVRSTQTGCQMYYYAWSSDVGAAERYPNHPFGQPFACGRGPSVFKGFASAAGVSAHEGTGHRILLL